MEAAPESLLRRNVIQTTTLLARGSMGDVFLGLLNSVPVAIKRLSCSTPFLDENGLFSEQAFERFCDSEEMMTLSAIEHAHLVPVLGLAPVSTSYPTPGIILQHLPTTLRERCRNLDAPRLLPKEELRILCDAFAGLDHIHSLQFVHGHITTNNIMLDSMDSSSCVAKITDICGHTCLSRWQNRSDLDRPSFLAPEVMRGEQCGCASDCYSLAVCGMSMVLRRDPPDLALLRRIGHARDLKDLPQGHPLRPTIVQCLRENSCHRTAAKVIHRDLCMLVGGRAPSSAVPSRRGMAPSPQDFSTATAKERAEAEWLRTEGKDAYAPSKATALPQRQGAPSSAACAQAPVRQNPRSELEKSSPDEKQSEDGPLKRLFKKGLKWFGKESPDSTPPKDKDVEKLLADEEDGLIALAESLSEDLCDDDGDVSLHKPQQARGDAIAKPMAGAAVDSTSAAAEAAQEARREPLVCSESRPAVHDSSRVLQQVQPPLHLRAENSSPVKVADAACETLGGTTSVAEPVRSPDEPPDGGRNVLYPRERMERTRAMGENGTPAVKPAYHAEEEGPSFSHGSIEFSSSTTGEDVAGPAMASAGCTAVDTAQPSDSPVSQRTAEPTEASATSDGSDTPGYSSEMPTGGDPVSETNWEDYYPSNSDHSSHSSLGADYSAEDFSEPEITVTYPSAGDVDANSAEDKSDAEEKSDAEGDSTLIANTGDETAIAYSSLDAATGAAVPPVFDDLKIPDTVDTFHAVASFPPVVGGQGKGGASGENKISSVDGVQLADQYHGDVQLSLDEEAETQTDFSPDSPVPPNGAQCLEDHNQDVLLRSSRKCSPQVQSETPMSSQADRTTPPQTDVPPCQALSSVCETEVPGDGRGGLRFTPQLSAQSLNRKKRRDCGGRERGKSVPGTSSESVAPSPRRARPLKITPGNQISETLEGVYRSGLYKVTQHAKVTSKISAMQLTCDLTFRHPEGAAAENKDAPSGPSQSAGKAGVSTRPTTGLMQPLGHDTIQDEHGHDDEQAPADRNQPPQATGFSPGNAAASAPGQHTPRSTSLRRKHSNHYLWDINERKVYLDKLVSMMDERQCETVARKIYYLCEGNDRNFPDNLRRYMARKGRYSDTELRSYYVHGAVDLWMDNDRGEIPTTNDLIAIIRMVAPSIAHTAYSFGRDVETSDGTNQNRSRMQDESDPP